MNFDSDRPNWVILNEYSNGYAQGPSYAHIFLRSFNGYRKPIIAFFRPLQRLRTRMALSCEGGAGESSGLGKLSGCIDGVVTVVEGRRQGN